MRIEHVIDVARSNGLAWAIALGALSTAAAVAVVLVALLGWADNGRYTMTDRGLILDTRTGIVYVPRSVGLEGPGYTADAGNLDPAKAAVRK